MKTLNAVVALALLSLQLGCGHDPAGPAQQKNTSGDGNGGGSDTVNVVADGHPEGELARSIPLGARPFGTGVSAAGVFYVTQLDAASMGRGILPEPVLQGSVAVGAVPTNVVFDAAGTTAYVTNQWSQNIGVVDIATNTQVGTIPIGGDPFNVVPSRDGGRLYVTTNADNVAVVDLASRTVLTTIPMPADPNGLVLNREGTRLYVSVPWSGHVVEVNTEDNSVLRTFFPGGKPQDLALSRHGERLYLANESGSLDIIEVATGEVRARTSLSGGGFGLALSPDDQQVYVAQPAGYLTILDRNGEIEKTLELGGMPRKVAFNARGKWAVIANEAGWVDFIH
jgi:YVTN family beta-propeller protein